MKTVYSEQDVTALVESKNDLVRENNSLRSVLEGWRLRAVKAEAEVTRLQEMVAGLADRVAAQSDLLSRRAEATP